MMICSIKFWSDKYDVFGCWTVTEKGIVAVTRLTIAEMKLIEFFLYSLFRLNRFHSSLYEDETD